MQGLACLKVVQLDKLGQAAFLLISPNFLIPALKLYDWARATPGVSLLV
jgi:hypothetical protein